jgi:hypothetical protein
MLLEAGPIPPLDASQFQFTLDQPDFAQMTSDAWAQIDSVTQEMDALVDPLAIFDEALTGDTILADLDEVDQINGDNAHLANLAGIVVGDGLKDNGDTALVFAVQSIPGEAFKPVPRTTEFATADEPAPTARISGVTLLDLTTMSGTQFYTGDQYQLQVHMDTTSPAVADYYAVHVWAELTKNQGDQPHLDLGFTDAKGTVTYTGQWGAGDLGNWTMFLHAQPTTGGDVVSQLYQWTVGDRQDRTSVPRPQAVSVQLIDWTSGDLGNAHVGDKWQLFVSGPPNEPVYLWGTFNGAVLAEVQLGTTDENGNFTGADVWGDDVAGDWVEYYAVGRFPWASSLVFRVQPRAGGG